MAGNKKAEDNAWKDVGWFALKTAGISAAVLGGVAVAVPAIGFTAGGVAAGSLAASFQSAVLGGTIASGSAFAVLQSVGAAGLAAGTQGAVVAASATAAGAHTVYQKLKKKIKAGKLESPGNDSAELKNELKASHDDCSEDEDDIIQEKEGEICKTSTKKNPFGISRIKEENTVGNLVESDSGVSSEMEKLILRLTKKDSLKREKSKKLSLESQWEDVELSDDVTITKSLMKKNKSHF